MHSNGDNRFWISVTCDYDVRDEEWGAILMLITMMLDKHDSGRFRNVHAHLEESTDSEGRDDE